MNPVRKDIRQVEFSIREISDRAASMEDVVRLDIGQPDFPTPAVVTEQMAEVIAEQNPTYTSLWGIPELRDAIARFEGHKFDISAENVMVSTGGIGALYCILDAFLDPEDTVIANDPAWSPYRLITAATPGDYRQVPYFDAEGNVQEQQIRDAIDANTKLLIINTPANPTGRVYTKEQVKQLCEIAADEDLYIIADEVYDQLLYDDATHYSPAQFVPERTLVVNSLSKNFAMTGWRLGWVTAANTELIQELGKVNRATTACPNYFSQQAALIALQDAQGYAETMQEAYQERKELVMEYVEELGWDCLDPQGAIYAFPDVGTDSWDFALDLLEQEKVAVVPGANDGSDSQTNIRICFGSADMDTLQEGFERIQRFIQ